MTERKATATAKAGYGAVGGVPSHVSKARHGAPISWWCDEQQIPGGNDREKGKGKNAREKQVLPPSATLRVRMTTRKARTTAKATAKAKEEADSLRE
jgi:hypothetical protein